MTRSSLLPLLPLAPALLLGCHVGGGDQSWTFSQDIRGVDVVVGNGSVTALPGAQDGVRIDWSGGGVGNARLRPEPYVHDGVVYLDADCGEACGGDLTVWLPEGVAFSAMVDTGDVSVELPGRSDVRACAAMGSVYVEVPGGAWDMDLEVGVGGLSVQGVVDEPTSPERLEACVAVGDLTILGR